MRTTRPTASAPSNLVRAKASLTSAISSPRLDLLRGEQPAFDERDPERFRVVSADLMPDDRLVVRRRAWHLDVPPEVAERMGVRVDRRRRDAGHACYTASSKNSTWRATSGYSRSGSILECQHAIPLEAEPHAADREHRSDHQTCTNHQHDRQRDGAHHQTSPKQGLRGPARHAVPAAAQAGSSNHPRCEELARDRRSSWWPQRRPT